MLYNVFMSINRSVVTLTNYSMFTFQRNKMSVQVWVRLLLCVAFNDHDSTTVAPSLKTELQTKKKSHLPHGSIHFNDTTAWSYQYRRRKSFHQYM